MERFSVSPHPHLPDGGWRQRRWWRVGVAFLVLGGAAAVVGAAVPGTSRTSSPSSTTNRLARIATDAYAVRQPAGHSDDAVSPDGSVTIEAYDSISIDEGSSGMVAVPLDALKSHALLAVLNKLPKGPNPRCMEDVLVYKLVVRVPGKRTVTDVAGWACDAVVLLSVGASPRPALHDASCALFHAVISDLPPNEAEGTRHATVGCKS